MKTPHLVFEPKEIAAVFYEKGATSSVGTLELIREGSFRTVTASRIRVKDISQQEASKIMAAVEYEKLSPGEKAKIDTEREKRREEAKRRFGKIKSTTEKVSH